MVMGEVLEGVGAIYIIDKVTGKRKRVRKPVKRAKRKSNQNKKSTKRKKENLFPRWNDIK